VIVFHTELTDSSDTSTHRRTMRDVVQRWVDYTLEIVRREVDVSLEIMKITMPFLTTVRGSMLFRPIIRSGTFSFEFTEFISTVPAAEKVCQLTR
jgi:hypothetical protein